MCVLCDDSWYVQAAALDPDLRRLLNANTQQLSQLYHAYAGTVRRMPTLRQHAGVPVNV